MYETSIPCHTFLIKGTIEMRHSEFCHSDYKKLSTLSPPPPVRYVLNGWLQRSSKVACACFKLYQINSVNHIIMAVSIRAAKLLSSPRNRLTAKRCVIPLWVAPVS